ncbi:MAG: hypothetical protein LIP02_05450 [Bacteroidales bacterium]|nr:hypothetical protein [Bacteroidales bacterium]
MIYFTDDTPAQVTFTPDGVTSVEVAIPDLASGKALYQGFSAISVVDNGDGSFTAILGEGRNILRLSNAQGDSYRVVRAKQCSYKIDNLTSPGEDPAPGDQITVTLDGVYHPVHKLAGIYNMNALVRYTLPDESVVESTANQYQFASTAAARAVTVKIPADWDVDTPYTLTGGHFWVTHYGDPFGSHREISLTEGRSANFTALYREAAFGSLPDLTLYGGSDKSGIGRITTTDRDSTPHYYNLMGQPVASPAAGQIVIERRGSGKARIVRF